MFETNRMLEGLQGSLWMFMPELVLCAGIIVFLILRLSKRLDQLHLGYVALIFAAFALAFAWNNWQRVPGEPIFGNLLVCDGLTVFVRMFLLGFLLLMILLSLLTGIPDREDSADFFSLLFGATVGMCLMGEANHLLVVYIAVEMASLPSYALAGFLKGRRQSSEAALKYVVYGGAASGVMLYGISLVAGRFGTAYLPDVAMSFAQLLSPDVGPGAAGGGKFDVVLLIGLLLIMVGMAFKLAAVPFHFWCPDVFEGAAAEVAAFLSVASKGAAVALVGRFTLSLAGPNYEIWKTVAPYLGPALAFFAAVTATFGNLAAYAQTNLKRLLAYSTIAHAGYMMMALATLNRDGLDAALFYLISYLFMNLGAFAVVAFIRNQTGSEDLATYGGMIQRAPVLTIALAVFLLSLVGLPPLMGYMAKFQVFAAIYKAAVDYNNVGLLVLLVIGLLNTVISLVYYVKVLKVMVIGSPPEGAANSLRVPMLQDVYAGLLALVVLGGMLLWDPLASTDMGSAKAVQHFKNTVPSKQDSPALQAANP
jgi:NADH-quinone oxidoreductase subunit N